MNLIKRILQQLSDFKTKKKQIELNCESLDIDKLSEVYSLSKDRVGHFLESELGWMYQSSIKLSPQDCLLEILEVDNLAKYSGLILTSGNAQKRFITSNPDLILESKEIYEKYSKLGYAFQIASREIIENCYRELLAVRSALSKVDPNQRKLFGVLFISLLDCLELGATEIIYRENKYFAMGENGKYEGELSVQIIKKLREELKKVEEALIGDMLRDLGCQEKMHLVVETDSFRLRFGTSELISPQEKIRENKHILLVDDDQRFINILKKGIGLKGFRVSVACTAKQAVEYINTSGVHIDLVISDFHMPNHTGASLIASIRNVDLNLPIIGLTGDSQSSPHISLINAGANAIVRKSDDPKVLFAWIYKFLDDQHHLRAA